MWIVRLAIDRPYTFVVVSMLLALISTLMAMRMAVDIFPNIDIPVVSVIWSFSGLSPEEMESRIITISERAMTMVTSDIEHMESVSLSGIGIIRVFLHQGADVGQAVALMSAINQMELIDMPQGITPPAVVAFSATDAPVMQLAVSSKVLTEAQLYDYDLNFIRTRLATVGGASIPLPYGGKQRQVMIDLYPDRLMSKGVSPSDVVNALSLQNIILPAGVARLGKLEFPVKINGSPNTLDSFNNIPIKQVNGATIYIKDIGYAHDGYSIQTNIVRMNGKRATLLNILRAGGASTLKVVQKMKKTLPLLKATLPKTLDIKIVNDQSQFVRGAITQVIHEAMAAAVLTGLLMLALLGSWRSTVIVATSIPLSIMTSIVGLGIFGQTLNTMTLGGLSLAVGMLVDDATVEVENIHRNLNLKLPIREAVLTSAAQVALPAFVSTISICIVFIPVTLLTEPSRSLFVPLGMAVVFAMLASYFFSRTLVPVMSVYLLKSEELPGAKVPANMSIEEAARQQSQAPPLANQDKGTSENNLAATPQGKPAVPNTEEQEVPPPEAMSGRSDPYRGQPSASGKVKLLSSVHNWINNRFNQLRTYYHAYLLYALEQKAATVIGFALFFLASCCLIPYIGQDFFPAVDAGQMRLHLVCPVGTRVDDTEQYFSRVETAIRRIVPANEIVSLTDNMGTPASGLSLCYGDNTNYTEFDGEMLITLDQEHHGSTFTYQKRIRRMLARDFPMLSYYFQPADITTQILNAGLQAPIDIQVSGLANREQNYKLAMTIRHEVSLIPGAVDVIVRQALHQPQINVDVDRSKAIQLGLSQHDVASSLLTSLSSSFQTSPSFWVNPKNGVNYTVAVQTPLYRTRTIDDIRRTLINGSGGLLIAGARANGLEPSVSPTSLTQSEPAAQPLSVSQSTQTMQPIPYSMNALSTLLATSSQTTTAAATFSSLSASQAALVSAAATSTLNTPPAALAAVLSIPSPLGTTSSLGTVNSATAQAPSSSLSTSTSQSGFTSAPDATVTALTSPSTLSIPSYLSTSATQSTLPASTSPSTLVPPPNTMVATLTTPSTLTIPATAATAALTAPSTATIPSYLIDSSTYGSGSDSGAEAVTGMDSALAAGSGSGANSNLTPGSQLTASSQASSTASASTSTQAAQAAQPSRSAMNTTAPASTSLSLATGAIPAAAAPSGVALTTNGLGVYRQASSPAGVASLLMNLASTRHSPASAMVSHYAIQPVFDIYANTQDRDLGGVANDVQKVIDRHKKSVAAGTLIYMRGQADSMNKAFSGLFMGIVFALILIYLLLVMNFQSWLDPLIILMAIPGALSGIVWALFITQTTFSVPALMGAIMSIGVGSANSILMVNFANEQQRRGDDATTAATSAGFIRFRPVVMTAMAMTIGMLPMAIGLGEGGGQNAPLGRAVIGGLIVATLSTLFFVPVMYSLLKTNTVTREPIH